MNIQFYPHELNYVNAKLHPAAPRSGSFLSQFLGACLSADGENYELLRPAVQIFIEKYPADPERLRMEEHDNGMTARPEAGK